MPRAKTSPHYQMHAPLLAAMHNLTHSKAGVKVRHVDATEEMCDLMGIRLDTHGKQDQTGQYWTVRWASLAMLDLKAKGLMDYPAKGWWVLTPAGAAQTVVTTPLTAPAPAAAPAAPVVAPAAPVVEAVKPEPLPEVAPPAPVVVEAAELLAYVPEPVEAVVDSYLLNLQMAAVPCFGSWSAKSEVCKVCPLASRCYEGMLAKLAALADELPLVAAAPAKAPTAPTTSKLSAATATLPAGLVGKPAKADDEVVLDLDSTPATKVAPAKAATPAFLKMEAASEVQCSVCKGTIAKGTSAAYSRKSGFSHIACVSNVSAGE